MYVADFWNFISANGSVMRLRVGPVVDSFFGRRAAVMAMISAAVGIIISWNSKRQLDSKAAAGAAQADGVVVYSVATRGR